MADRFIAQGLAGLADRREDNGENKVTEFYEHELLYVVADPPAIAALRPTWTQELLSLVLGARTGVKVSTTTGAVS